MKKLLTVLLLLALVAWLAFKAAVWYLADSRLAQAREGLSEYGVLLRGEIGSSVAGELSLRDTHFQPFRLTQGIEAALLQYRTPSAVALLESLATPSQLPADWTLEGDGLGLTLDPAMIKNWVAADPDAPPALFAPVCGPDFRQGLGSGDLIRMGITEVTGDLLLRQQPAALRFELNTSAVGSLELEWPGARLDPTRPGELMQTTDQPLHLILRDGGLMRKVAAYCARETGMAIETWAQRVTSDFTTALAARGLEPSQQLRALYQRWLTEGGKLEVRLQPGAPALGIPVHREGQPEAAELTVQYNDARVPEVYLMAAEPRLPEVPAQAREPVTDGVTEAVPDWRASPVAEAMRWLERRVRVTLNSGRVVEGRLTGIGESRLEVSRAMDGGEVAYPIAIRGISLFEVWRRPGDQGQPLPPTAEPESTPAATEPPAGETGTGAPGAPEN